MKKKYSYYEFDDGNEIFRVFNSKGKEIDGCDYEDLAEMFLEEHKYKEE